jgi:excisionase family DNA binding protein
VGAPHTTWTSQASPVLHVPSTPSSESDDPATPARLLTIRQIAGACQLSEKAVRRAIDDGELTAIKLRSRLRVTPQDFEAWIESSRRASEHAPHAAQRRVRRPAPSGTFRALIQTNTQTVIER